MTCFFCGGVAHPATGHAYTATCLCCGPCYRVHIKWVRARAHNPIWLEAVKDRGQCDCPLGGPPSWNEACQFCKGYP